MKLPKVFLLVAALLSLNLSVLAEEKTVGVPKDPNFPDSSVPGETKAAHDARMDWWRKARFGMFIHWGLYSSLAGYYQGKQVSGYGEWIMFWAKIPLKDYQPLAKDFNPVDFSAEKIVTMAKNAGMKYIVITAKHHDGFAMFDSKANDWNIVKGTPYGKDPLKLLAEECRKQGIKLGFYYSQAQDWNHGGVFFNDHGKIKNPKWDKAQDYDTAKYVDQTVLPHIAELLTNYGLDVPAVFWWDTPGDLDKDLALKMDALVQKLRPGLIQNNRLYVGVKGDTETPEQYIPGNGFPGRDWETCMTLNDTWGFKTADANWKSTTTLIRNLVDIASKGGNYLLNIGPDGYGAVPYETEVRLAQIGDWMKVNGEAIYETGPTPFGAEAGEFSPTELDKKGRKVFNSDWAWRATTKPGHLYITIFTWPRDGTISIPAYAQKISKVTMLGNAGLPLTVRQNEKGMTISGLPKDSPNPYATVLDLAY